MKSVKLTEELVPAFREYFALHAKEQDESFPPADDYTPQDDEPAYLLMNSDGKIAGAAVLMLHKEYAEARTGRFRIFHCIAKEEANYRSLLESILPHAAGLDDIYCFVDDIQEDTRKVWVSLGFKIKRYSWVLKRPAEKHIPAQFPPGFGLRDLREGLDEQPWCDIINESFADLSGHVQMYPSKIAAWRKEPAYLNNGMKLLWHEEKPVATMSLTKENENGEEMIFIDAVGVLNSYQGRGLGRNLIRAGIEFAQNYGAASVMLSVNAENERASELYIREGFRKEALIMCYSFKISK